MNSPARRASPADRGTTTIADKVFERIAGQAAADVERASGRTGGFLGLNAAATARPKVDVSLNGDSVDLEIEVGIAYPGSLRAAAQEIRERVSRTVQSLTGVAVHRVDLDITFLVTPAGADGSTTTVLR